MEMKKENGKMKEKGKEGERREIVRVPAKSAAATAGWSATRALSGGTQRVARRGKRRWDIGCSGQEKFPEFRV